MTLRLFCSGSASSCPAVDRESTTRLPVILPKRRGTSGRAFPGEPPGAGAVSVVWQIREMYRQSVFMWLEDLARDFVCVRAP